jgi:hypothetical protein
MPTDETPTKEAAELARLTPIAKVAIRFRLGGVYRPPFTTLWMPGRFLI